MEASEGVANIFTTAVDNVMAVIPTVINTVTSNPVLATFFAVGILGIAIGAVSRLKRI